MTIQLLEIFDVAGAKFGSNANPLSFWLDACRPNLKFASMGSWCWRGYVGTWTIDQGRLYLVSIKGKDSDGAPITVESLFPGFPNGVFAHWFSGAIHAVQRDSTDDDSPAKITWTVLQGRVVDPDSVHHESIQE